MDWTDALWFSQIPKKMRAHPTYILIRLVDTANSRGTILSVSCVMHNDEDRELEHLLKRLKGRCFARVPKSSTSKRPQNWNRSSLSDSVCGFAYPISMLEGGFEKFVISVELSNQMNAPVNTLV